MWKYQSASRWRENVSVKRINKFMCVWTSVLLRWSWQNMFNTMSRFNKKKITDFSIIHAAINVVLGHQSHRSTQLVPIMPVNKSILFEFLFSTHFHTSVYTASKTVAVHLCSGCLRMFTWFGNCCNYFKWMEKKSIWNNYVV